MRKLHIETGQSKLMKHTENKIKLCILILTVFTSIVVSMYINVELGSFLFITSSIIIPISLWNVSPRLKSILYVSLTIRVLYIVYIYSLDSYLFRDTQHYINMLDSMLSSKSVDFITVSNITGTIQFTYYYLIYYVYKLFPLHVMLNFANVLLFVIGTMFLEKFIRTRIDARTASITTVLIILSPTLFLFTSNILKDSLVFFLTMFALFTYGLMITSKGKFYRILFFILTMINISLLVMSRIYSGIGLLLGMAFDFIFVVNKEGEYINKKFLFSFVGVILLIVPFLANNVRYISMGIDFFKNSKFSFDMLVNTIKTMVSFAISPLPWNVVNNYDQYYLVVFDAIFLIVFSPLLISLIYEFIINRQFRLKLILYLIPIIINALALAMSYEHAPVRQKISVYPFILLIYSLSYIIHKEKKEKKIIYEKNSVYNL